MIVISQINLLICLVNDILDMKMIEQGKFVKRDQRFNPLKTFKFILNIFAQQAEMQGTDLSFHAVPLPLNRESKLKLFVSDQQAGTKNLPDMISGDQIRLKQILVNLVKNAIKFSRARQIKILAGYDYQKSIIHVQVDDEGKGIKADE